MKTIFRYSIHLLVILFALSASGCSLGVGPVSTVVPDKYKKNITDTVASLVGIRSHNDGYDSKQSKKNKKRKMKSNSKAQVVASNSTKPK